MNNVYSYMEQYFNTNGSSTQPTEPEYTGKLTEAERQALKENNIKELEPSEITNNNLKDNDNIKGVITGEVPIPVGGEYKEGTKETGVVVTMGESEFVWVPVPDISEMAVLQAGSTENYQGVLYDFSGTTATKRAIETIGGESGYREPDVLTHTISGEANTDNLAIINNILGTTYTVEQFQTVLQNDYNSMITSVTKYKGFFVGRYEISLDADKKVHSKVGVMPTTGNAYNENKWYGLYAYQKKMAEANGLTSVNSHMIWGSNYDAMLRWMLTGAEKQKVTENGNAAHSDLSSVYETGKMTVEEKTDKINNVYDLEGNGREWTAEAYDNGYRSGRGGTFNEINVPSFRGKGNPSYNIDSYSSRLVLFIKL